MTSILPVKEYHLTEGIQNDFYPLYCIVDYPLCLCRRRIRLQRINELFRFYRLEHRVVDYYYYFLGKSRSLTAHPPTMY